ncbi:unnamed protein product [Blepharisma stoltei]|uniref:WD repeat-containing protein 44 n=1 Tax=Blepharisma stoltei TaxID=1481888 RepID=A0AAU9IQ75_9CILI|nr:unnamed protein product [Blepharisma stoltei]
METSGASDEEFFDAAETKEELTTPIKRTSSYGSLNVPSAQIEIDITPFYSQTGAKDSENKSNPTSLSQYSTDQSCPKDSDQSMLFTWSSKNFVKKNRKDSYEFAGLEIVQEITINQDAAYRAWVLKISPDGKYLAAAGDDPAIKLYEFRYQFMNENFKLFSEEPVNLLEGHNQPVIDLSWSKSSTFLISAGADCMVYLWRIGNNAPVLEFKHPQIVSSVCFHPENANYFLTGCFDRMVRIWNIPNYSLECYYQAPDFITAATFSPLGHFILLGLSHGQCMIYETNFQEMKLSFLTQIQCKNRKGRKKDGRKITGFDFLDDQQFIVTTNDSRIRLYSLEDFNIKQKYKGCKNEKFPLKASFSHNSMHLVSGSENGKICIWNTFCNWVPRVNPILSRKKSYKNSSYESFTVGDHKSAAHGVFVPEIVIKKVQQTLLDTGSDLIISHILLIANEGKLKVLFNQYKNVKW